MSSLTDDRALGVSSWEVRLLVIHLVAGKAISPGNAETMFPCRVDGTRHLVFEPLEFLEKLAALILVHLSRRHAAGDLNLKRVTSAETLRMM
jgi:hypothetical protein